MNDRNKLFDPNYLWLKHYQHQWFVLIGLMILSIVGVALADATERLSHWYWLAMVPVFFGACLFIEWKTTKAAGLSAHSIIIKQTLHWSGLLTAVLMTFFLRTIGSLDNQTTGLVLLLLFALTTFLAGVTMGWLFRLLGIFLALCLFLFAYMEHFIWITIWLALLIFVAHYFLLKHFGHPGITDTST